MKTVLSSKGHIILPADIRRQDGLRPGQRFEIERVEAGRYLLTKLPGRTNEGLIDWLLACPEKDWFEPILSELTDSLRRLPSAPTTTAPRYLW